MTAVLGILNKQAIAIAADSAVTIDGYNGRKIFNKANKIFSLSKHHPLGVMLYNSASFMSTPWEVIIKVYRKQLKDNSFNHLSEYVSDFIGFLQKNNYFTSNDLQKNYLAQTSWKLLKNLVEVFEDQNPDLKNMEEDQINQAFRERFAPFLVKIKDTLSQGDAICDDFANWDFDSFLEFTSPVTIDVLGSFEILKEINEVTSLFHQILFEIIRSKNDFSGYTGLIFVGYGDSEIYPRLIPVHIADVVDDKLRYYIDEQMSGTVSDSNSGIIRPFAQTDVIDTILSGVDPTLDSIYMENFGSLLKKYNDAILSNIGVEHEVLRTQIQGLNTKSIIDEYINLNNQIRNERYIVPLMNAVSSLSKEDLAEMAESLIYLTYLKRRITFAEESVGGPVDVAIISKGDGGVFRKLCQFHLRIYNFFF